MSQQWFKENIRFKYQNFTNRQRHIHVCMDEIMQCLDGPKKKKITASQNFFKINLFLFQKYTPPVYKTKLLDNT